MVAVALVTAWALVEAVVAVVLMAQPTRRSRQTGSLFSGLADWRC